MSDMTTASMPFGVGLPAGEQFDAPADAALARVRQALAYYDQSYPAYLTPAVPATGATAGIPGAFTPAGCTPPLNVQNLIQGVPRRVTASPNTPWTTGQYVQTVTAGAPGRATWTGTAWVGGPAPLEAEAEPAAEAKPKPRNSRAKPEPPPEPDE